MLRLPVELEPVVDSYGQGGTLLFLFDHDSALAPVLAESGMLERRLRKLLGSLSTQERMAVGVIGDGSLGRLKESLGLHRAYYSGSGGLEFDLQGVPVRHPQAEHFFDKLEVLASGVEREIAEVRGAWVEKNPLGFSVRCRVPTPEMMARLRECTKRELANFDGDVRIQEGLHGIEVVPRTDWTKARAIETVAAASGNRNGKLLFAGDGEKEAESFETAKRLGGMTIAIGGSDPPPKHVDLLLPDAVCLLRLLEEVFSVLARERDLTL
jgi:trehalose-phosphatase